MIFSKRPRRHTRELVEHFLRCPLCWGDGHDQAQFVNPEKVKHPRPLRVVAYRNLGVRLECASCGLRFTVPIAGDRGLAEVLQTEEIDLRNEASTELERTVDVSSVDLDDVDYPVRIRELMAQQLLREHEAARQER